MNAVQVGVVVDGKYRIDAVLGQGGMGMVVSAWHLHLDERVAIKFLLPHVLGNASVVARFQREARAAAKIKGEHVCRVLDVGVTGDGQPFMVMEHLEGEDLGKLGRRRGPLPAEEAIHYVLQVCEALAEAHGKGIVHRDLKPANLFLTRRPNGTALVKVLDFGISKLAGGESGGEVTLTSAHAVVGSFAYMSPEQARNARDIDHRCDIWSLGVVLHKLLTGSSPFEAGSASEFIAKIVADPPARLCPLRLDLPMGLERVVLCCLEKDRTRRYQTVADLALALAPFVPRDAELVSSIQSIARRQRELDAPSTDVAATPHTPPSSGAVPPVPSFGSAPSDPSARSAPPPGPGGAVGPAAGGMLPTTPSTTIGAWTPPPGAPRGGTGRLVAVAAIAVVLLVGGAMAMLVRTSPTPSPGDDAQARPVSPATPEATAAASADTDRDATRPDAAVSATLSAATPSAAKQPPPPPTPKARPLPRPSSSRPADPFDHQ